MAEKLTIEVFKDNDYLELDSDEIAHALATVDAIKPYVEIINRGTRLKLNESQEKDMLDVSKRVRVALCSDVGVLYTGRKLIDTQDAADDSQMTGILLGTSRLAVVSTASKNITRTARHEVGHYIYGVGSISPTADDLLDHCKRKDCVMHEFIISNRRQLPASRIRRIAAEHGFKSREYEDIVVSTEFCTDCHDALQENAFRRALVKHSPALAEIIFRKDLF